MNISTLSIRRSVATYLIFLTLVLMGLYFTKSMKVSFYPDFSAPVLIIMAPYRGATPSQVEENLTKLIEKAISSAEGIDNIESTSSEGLSMIIVRLRWEANTKKVKEEIREKIDLILPRLPKEVETPTILEVQNLLPPSVLVSVSSKRLKGYELRKFVEDKILFHFQKIPDSGIVEILGGEERYIGIFLRDDKLKEFSITSDEIERAFVMENIDYPSGSYRLTHKEFLVRVKGKVNSIEDLKNIPVAVRDNQIVRMKDIAYVGFYKKEPHTIFRLNGKDVLVVSVRKKNDGNTVHLCDEARRVIKELKKMYPDLELKIIKDESTFIKKSIKTVLKNALYGGILAAIVILLFLRNLRGTIIISVSIPSAIVSSFVLMKIFNLSINTISLGGLAIAVGMVVDASIVVLENIERNMETYGEKSLKLFGKATSEVVLAVFASILTSVVVFLPMAFLKGMASVLLGELALTVVFALFFSAFVSLSLIPTISYDFLKPKTEEKRISKKLKTLVEKIINLYARIIKFSLKSRKRAFNVIGFSFFLLFISFYPLKKIDFTMLPEVDQGEYRIDFKYSPGVSIYTSAELTENFEKLLEKIPYIENVYTVVGKGFIFGEESPSIGYVYVTLKETKKRKHVNYYVGLTRELIEKNRFAGLLNYTVKRVEPTEGMIRPPIDLNVYGDDLSVLKKISDELIKRLSKIDGVFNLESSMDIGKPEFSICPERERLFFYRKNSLFLGKQLRTYYGELKIGEMEVEGKTYELRISRRLKTISPENVELKLSESTVLPLSLLSHFKIEETPLKIKRFDFQRFVEVKGELEKGSKRELKKKVRKIISSIKLPEGYTIKERGASRAVVDSFKTLGFALIIAIFLVYVVMASQFNSFSQPFIISFTIPLAFIGIFWGLFITGTPLSMNSFLGIIVLAGIVVNNGILLVDFINQKRGSGLELKEAVLEGSKLRIRPILMTAMTTIFGMLPLAMSSGVGNESLKPLAITVVSGLLTSTLFTPIIIPLMYFVFTKKENK